MHADTCGALAWVLPCQVVQTSRLISNHACHACHACHASHGHPQTSSTSRVHLVVPQPQVLVC